jgi:hypothetical protein
VPAANDSSTLGDLLGGHTQAAVVRDPNTNTSSSTMAGSKPRGLKRCTCGHFVTELGAAPINRCAITMQSILLHYFLLYHVPRGYWFNGVEDVQMQRKKISMLCPSAEVLYHESPHDQLVSPFLWHAPEKGPGHHPDDKIVVKHLHRKDRRSKDKKGGKSFRSVLLRGPENANQSAYRRSGSTNRTNTGYKMVVYQVMVTA